MLALFTRPSSCRRPPTQPSSPALPRRPPEPPSPALCRSRPPLPIDVAREKAEARGAELRVERISAKAGEGKVTLSAIASTVSPGHQTGLDLHQVNVILKVDLQGSIEAIRQAIQVIPQDNVNLKFLLQAPGDVSNSDIDLAVATKAVIFGFNVKVPGSVKSYADNKSVEIRTYRVIYDLIDDLRNAMEGLLEPVEEQIPIGGAEVRATFSSGSGRAAGCMVTEGKVMKGCGIRIIRNGKTIYGGTLDSLRRVKEMVKEVGAGLECGIAVNDYTDWEVGDVVEVFNTVKKQRTLEEASASVTTALAKAGVEL